MVYLNLIWFGVKIWLQIKKNYGQSNRRSVFHFGKSCERKGFSKAAIFSFSFENYSRKELEQKK